LSNSISKIAFQKADDDLGLAKLAIANHSFLDIANFHLQQASEKLQKSYLAFKEIEFPRTHDLDILYNLCYRTQKKIPPNNKKNHKVQFFLLT
jgi:HEPN domain-containing protein